MAPSPAERLLQELGITEPKELTSTRSLTMSALASGFVRWTGEAHILGCDDQALITIKADSSPRRKRFSIVHELGHWHHHRGKSLVCRADEYRPHDAMSPEKVADSYAADLLYESDALTVIVMWQPECRPARRATILLRIDWRSGLNGALLRRLGAAAAGSGSGPAWRFSQAGPRWCGGWRRTNLRGSHEQAQI